jgi:citrate synthase
MIPALREERARLLEDHGSRVVSDVSALQIVRGMRDVNALVCDTSVVDPDKGLIIRGIPVAHLAGKLPEEVFHLLLVGELPPPQVAETLRAEIAARARVRDHVWRVLEAMPGDSHPMTMLSAAVLVMEKESKFRPHLVADMKPADHWRAALEDALRLIGALPAIAAGVYRMHYKKGKRIPHAKTLDWAANLAHMLGNDDEKFYDLMRLATVVQSDHEGGHASALTAHTVGSALSSLFYAVSAGWNALAGPRHGLASQICLRWVLDAMDRYGGVPSEEQIREYAWDALNAGRVIPGYGHAVLRGQDPRYLAILAFGEKNTPRDSVFKTVVAMSKVIPSVLMEHGKTKNPWPNVDAINGSLFHHYGIKEIDFYTVFFAVALAFGFSAQYVLNRALGSPIMRPRSVTTKWLEQQE